MTELMNGQRKQENILMNIGLNNFRSFELVDLNFPSKSTTIITGSNNSGKSSLLSAINYSLWGVSLYPTGNICSPRDLVREGTESLSVRFKNDKIDSTRWWKESPGMSLFLEGVDTKGSRVEINEALLKYLGVNQYTQSQLAALLFRVFYITPYSPCILSMAPTERTRYLLSVFGYDVLRELQLDFSSKLKDNAAATNLLTNLTLPELKEIDENRYNELKELLKDKPHYKSLDILLQRVRTCRKNYNDYEKWRDNVRQQLPDNETFENKSKYKEIEIALKDSLKETHRLLRELNEVLICPICESTLIKAEGSLQHSNLDKSRTKEDLLADLEQIEKHIAANQRSYMFADIIELLENSRKELENRKNNLDLAIEQHSICEQYAELGKELEQLELERAANEKVRAIYQTSLEQNSKKKQLEQEAEILRYINRKLADMSSELVEYKTLQFCSFYSDCLNKIGISERLEPRFIFSKEESSFKAIDFLISENDRKTDFFDIGSLAMQNVLKLLCVVAERQFFESPIKNLDMILLDDCLPSTYGEFRGYINNTIGLLNNTTKIIAIADTSGLSYDQIFKVERINGVSRVIE